MFDKSKVNRLSDAKMSERFMGGSQVEDHLDASDWCSFNVPRIHVPEEMESMEPEACARAEEIVEVENLVFSQFNYNQRIGHLSHKG